MRSKTERTTKQEDQFNTLRESAEARNADIQQLARQVEQDFQSRWGDVQQQLMKNVEDVIKNFGQENGYDLLLNNSVVFYSSDNINDVTKQVISALNAAKSGEQENGGED